MRLPLPFPNHEQIGSFRRPVWLHRQPNTFSDIKLPFVDFGPFVKVFVHCFFLFKLPCFNVSLPRPCVVDFDSFHSENEKQKHSLIRWQEKGSEFLCAQKSPIKNSMTSNWKYRHSSNRMSYLIEVRNNQPADWCWALYNKDIFNIWQQRSNNLYDWYAQPREFPR